jgi:hypothetical protein
MSHFTSLTVDVDLGELAKSIAQEGESVARDIILGIDEEVSNYNFSEGLVLDLIKALKKYRQFRLDHMWESFVEDVRKEIAD